MPGSSNVVDYVVSLREQAKRERHAKEKIWRECWDLYRGHQDYSDKMDWQSKIVLPKAFSSVKQATNIVKRLLSLSYNPWKILPVNEDDPVMAARANQYTELVRRFLEMANYLEEIGTAIECGFITGIGIVKLWWGASPRRYKVPTKVQLPDGTFDIQIGEQIVPDARLFIQAVDPFNFYWLPGSRMNDWVGTIEESEVPKWKLLQDAEEGIAPFDPDKIKSLAPYKISEDRRQSIRRFDEVPTSSRAEGSESIKLTEYFGPLVIDGRLEDPYGHVIVANDTELLLVGSNPFLHKKPPYVGHSPLKLPFRTDGVGIIEMVRDVDRTYNQLVNLAMDTGLFRLLPVFEVWSDAFENPEELNTGLVPGKILTRNRTFQGPGLVPVQFQDISQGSVQLMSILDRAHQEGSLISEIQQALPRYRGIMTATETQAKQLSQDNFFGGLASDIENSFIKPLIEMAMELVLQYIDTSTDPRIGRILGLEGEKLVRISPTDVVDIIQGDYIVRVSGISEQIEKMETLRNLVQFMNVIGQNPQAWMPYIKQDKVLRALISAFRPVIHNVDEFIESPETIQQKMAMMQQQAIQHDVVRSLPGILKAAVQAQSIQNKSSVERDKLSMQAARLMADIEAMEQKQAEDQNEQQKYVPEEGMELPQEEL